MVAKKTAEKFTPAAIKQAATKVLAKAGAKLNVIGQLKQLDADQEHQP